MKNDQLGDFAFVAASPVPLMLSLREEFEHKWLQDRLTLSLPVRMVRSVGNLQNSLYNSLDNIRPGIQVGFVWG